MKILVLINYNGGQFLRETLDSISQLNSIKKDLIDVHILCTGGGEQNIKDLKRNAWLTIKTFAERLPIAENWNRSIRYAKNICDLYSIYTHFAIFHDDDIYLPAVVRAVEAADPDVIIAGRHKVRASSIMRKFTYYAQYNYPKKRENFLIKNQLELMRYICMRKHYDISTPAVIYPRAALEFLRYKQRYGPALDVEALLHLSVYFPIFMYNDSPLCEYRLHNLQETKATKSASKIAQELAIYREYNFGSEFVKLRKLRMLIDIIDTLQDKRCMMMMSIIKSNLSFRLKLVLLLKVMIK